MKYTLKPIYRPFYQLPYCCVPATLQWILYRHGFDILDQETIGGELGLRLPLKAKQFFTNKKIKYLQKEPKEGFGTQIEKKKYSIGNFFIKYNIPLAISGMNVFKNKNELKKFLVDNLSKNSDIIVRYNNHLFKRKGQKSCGHFAVIAEFDDTSEKVIIGDPELPHFRKTTLKQLLYSISNQIDGIQRGLYVVNLSSPNQKDQIVKVRDSDDLFQ